VEAFVARQPILDRQEKIAAYELLFRSGEGNHFVQSSEDPAGEQATTKVITNSFLVIGMETLTSGKQAYINFSGDLLKKKIPHILPRELVGVEILDDQGLDDEVIAACKELHEAGYILALDDFDLNSHSRCLLPYVDLVKIDFYRHSYAEIRQILQSLRDYRLQFTAEKVETREAFEWALANDFDYFQGYYFSKPVVISGRDIPSDKLTLLMLLKEVNKPDDQISFDQIEEIVKRDVSLSFNLLRYINSAAFGLRRKMESIKHALVFLGANGLKKWINLFALRGLSEDKPDVLSLMAIIRARFCEMMATPMGIPDQSFDLFLLGLLSLIDAFVDRPKSSILAELPVDQELRAALLENTGPMADLLALVAAYEKGEWAAASQLAAKLGIDEDMIPGLYFEALKWANEISFIQVV